MRDRNRSQALDVLRGIAILLVLGRHLKECPRDYPWMLLEILDEWRRFGWVGVDLFFVLSGFLVSGLIYKEYQKTGAFRPFLFLARRGFKIYPAFYVCMFGYMALAAAYKSYFPMRSILGEAFFLQSYVGNILGVTWSLSVEEHFYILLCALLYGLSCLKGSNPFAQVPRIFGAIAALLLILRLQNFNATPYNYITHLCPTHLRLDSLFFGVLIGYFHHYEPARLKAWYERVRRVLPWACAMLVCYPLFNDVEFDWLINTFGFAFLYLGFGGVLLIALYEYPEQIQNKFLRTLLSGVAFIGFYSYSIYLWHDIFYRVGPLLLYSITGLSMQYTGTSIMTFAGAIVWGVLIATLVETPALKLRERWFPAPGKAKVASAPVPVPVAAE